MQEIVAYKTQKTVRLLTHRIGVTLAIIRFLRYYKSSFFPSSSLKFSPTAELRKIGRCDGMVDVADSKSADGNIMWVRVPPPAPARHKRHIACDELFIKAHRSLILLCLAFRPANASLVYRARELRNTKISELLPPGTSERACAAAPPLRIEPAASGFGLALSAGPKAAASIRLQYNSI